MPTVTRSDQSRLALIIALLIGTVLASAIAALAAAGASHATPVAVRAAAPAVALGAFDVAAPTPIEVTFAKPQPPQPTRHATASRTRPQPVRTTRAARPAATTSPLCSGPGWVERRGTAALAGLLHATPAGVTVSFLPGGGALKGMTYYDRHHVDVFVQSCARESDTLLRHVVAHEMGHAWDSVHMTDELRARYLAARGIATGTPWFGCNKCQDFATPAGDFAETYAQWQRGASDNRSTVAPAASPAQLASLGAEFFS
ncbi:MAG: hypothetical protein JJD92_08300 [Frankiaceae bacterium]|nr:hypothetical protein [Frankiaceae bacterium]